ncbi:phospho-N-acetylmuramoyl-pentapeptide-transferase [Patescibacteria group bacterium]|jgi:phospho-N-acetylmuramoyl-pentapeptide-transferase|nr:phospho-N-acetylmuramoyl-pentapeptide-transferase [Patescibacteria group bacterium]
MTAPPLAVAAPLLIAAACFLISALSMPVIIRLLRRFKMGKTIRDAKEAPIMSALHKDKAGTPTMGGIVIWATVFVVVFGLAGACWGLGEGSWACQANFLSRGQTWLPLALMAGAALIGLVDDYLNIRRLGSGKSGGLRERERLLSYTLIAVAGAWWFFTKLSWDQLHIPFVGTYNIGWWYVPFFITVVVSTSHSVNETDGLDGLAGGTLLASFAAFGIIAWSQGRFDLATLCAAIIGALLGFLWFNVNPAEVFMGDTGSMSLGTALAVVALMTNQPILLILIGLPFVVETVSVLIQLTSKKLRKGKKVFLSSPLHHHLQAIGWSEPRIVMRFWMISFVLAGVGTVLALFDQI